MSDPDASSNVTHLNPSSGEGLVDCHNHMLPGIDDGAHDIEMSLAMARRAVESGIGTVVCTPHHLNGVYRNFRQAVIEQVAEMNSILGREGIPLRVLPGSELHLVPELPKQIQSGEALTYGDHGNAVLVELPTRTIPAGTEAILERLAYDGFAPVIAHPERNAVLAGDPDRAVEWTTWGCKLQITSMSCAGRFGKPIQAVSRQWIEGGHAHLIASDAHRPSGRAPDLRAGIEAVTQWVGEDIAKIITMENPRRLSMGEELMSPPASENASRRSRSKNKSGPGFFGRLFGKS